MCLLVKSIVIALQKYYYLVILFAKIILNMKIKAFFKNIWIGIVTKEIYQDKAMSKSLYRYFLVGLLIRVLFLPFFFQRDILSTYQRAAQTVFNGVLGADFQQFLTHILHSTFLFIAKPFIPAVQELSTILLNSDNWVSWIDFNNFAYVYRTLALFKLPYLILDIAIVFILFRLLYDGKPKTRLKVFAFWAFNPLVIFVTYLFARHDIIGLFITLVAILLAKYGRKYWSIAFLAVAIALRFFPIMILPFLILYLAKKKRDYVILLAMGVVGLAGIEGFSLAYFGKSLIFSLLNTQHFDYILSAKLDLIIHDAIFIFIVAYALLVFSFIHQKKKTFSVLLSYCGIAYLLYVSLSYFHPQYLLWAMPFAILVFARRRSLFYYHIIQFVLLMFVLIYWGDLVTKFLIAPIDINYALYSVGPIPLINRVYNPVKFVNIFRSLFTAVSLWMAFLIYRSRNEQADMIAGEDLKS